jgi:hypothetical protein
MRHQYLALGILALQFVNPAMAQCDRVPQIVQAYLKSDPGWKLVDTNDLVADDQRLWAQYHKNLCPGFASVDLDGSGTPYYALALLHRDGGKVQEKLTVMHLRDGAVVKDDLVPVSNISFTSVPALSVVWKAPGGVYRDSSSNRKVTIKHDAIVYERMEATARAYYLLNGHFEFVQTSN